MKSYQKTVKKPLSSKAILEELNEMLQELSQDKMVFNQPVFIECVRTFKGLLKKSYHLPTTEFLAKMIRLFGQYYTSSEKCLKYAKLVFNFAVMMDKADAHTYGVLMNVIAESSSPNVTWARKLFDEARTQPLHDDLVLFGIYIKVIHNKYPAPHTDDIEELLTIWNDFSTENKIPATLAALISVIARSDDPTRGKRVLKLLDEAKRLNLYEGNVLNSVLDGLAKSQLSTRVKRALDLFDQGERDNKLDDISCSIIMNVISKSVKKGDSEIAIDFLKKITDKHMINKNNYLFIFSSMINILQNDRRGPDLIFKYVEAAKVYGKLDSAFYAALFFALAECKDVSIAQIIEIYEEASINAQVNSYVIGAVLTALAKKNPPGIKEGLALLKEAEDNGIVSVPAPQNGMIDLHSMTYGEAFFTLCRIFKKMAQSQKPVQKLLIVHGRGNHTKLKRQLEFDKKSPLQNVTDRIIHHYRPQGIIQGTKLISSEGATEVIFCSKKNTSSVGTAPKTWAKPQQLPSKLTEKKSEDKMVPPKTKTKASYKKKAIIESYNHALIELYKKNNPDSDKKALSLFHEAEKQQWVNRDTYKLVMQILSANDQYKPEAVQHLYDQGIKKGVLKREDTLILEGRYKIKDASAPKKYFVQDLKPKMPVGKEKPNSKLNSAAKPFVPRFKVS